MHPQQLPLPQELRGTRLEFFEGHLLHRHLRFDRRAVGHTGHGQFRRQGSQSVAAVTGWLCLRRLALLRRRLGHPRLSEEPSPAAQIVNINLTFLRYGPVFGVACGGFLGRLHHRGRRRLCLSPCSDSSASDRLRKSCQRAGPGHSVVPVVGVVDHMRSLNVSGLYLMLLDAHATSKEAALGLILELLDARGEGRGNHRAD
mmetsp:Transcript_25251/g.46928  ORF Transcript_25251/g.46928 Transcript_25251/m.46928 type:complete len:201 (+) Transcript_25251:229-831(+)